MKLPDAGTARHSCCFVRMALHLLWVQLSGSICDAMTVVWCVL